MTKAIKNEYDVVIMGGGLAGLTLARQLSLWCPEASVLIVERRERPLPEATHKVGESSVEIAGVYFSRTLELKSYFDVRHVEKMGLRFFYDNDKPFHQRPELGLSEFPGLASMQIDRGRLENDLRELAVKSDATLLEGYKFKDFAITEGKENNRVEICPVNDSGNVTTVQCRWVIDASGRRKTLQRKFNLSKEYGRPHSSTWFRFKGHVDVKDLVDPSHKEWHDRVPNQKRYNSTNHLHSAGAWVWAIPLGSDTTSVGIVVNEDINPFHEISSFEKSMAWIKKREPEFWEYIKDLEPMDFLYLRKYNHSATQVFSADGWACVGESGVFPDPYLSNGSNLIAAANTIVTEFIIADKDNKLDEQKVAFYDQMYLSISQSITDDIQSYYLSMDNPITCGMKFVTGLLSVSGFLFTVIVGYLMEKGSMFNEEKIQALSSAQESIDRLKEIRGTMKNIFDSWDALDRGQLEYTFFDYLKIKVLRDLWTLTLKENQSPSDLVNNIKISVDIAEATLLATFVIAVEDVLPSHFDRVSQCNHLNANAISLNPENWDKDSLFDGKEHPEVFHTIYDAIRQQLRLKNQLDKPENTAGQQLETCAS